MEHLKQEVSVVANVAQKFNMEAAWTLKAANALAGASPAERAVISVSSEDRQLALLDELVQSAATGQGVTAGPGPGVGNAAGAASTAGLGVGSAAAGAGAVPAAAVLDLILKEQRAMFEGQQAMLPMIRLATQLLLTEFEYTASKASMSQQQGDDFKAQLQTFYGNTADDHHQLRCMLLDVQLPMTLVTGSHLFKYCWKQRLRTLLGLSDINDPRNGLLLFKPLEHAFDDSRICFSVMEEAGEPKFMLELLDLSLKDVKLWDYAKKHNLRKGYVEDKIGDTAAEVTFGELQGKPLVFKNANRPYKRCLQFQAVQAVRRAKEEKWLPADWAPMPGRSCNSEEAKAWMDAWLAAAANAPPPDVDTSSAPEQ